MIYNPPIIPFQTELYSLLSDTDEVSFKVFDSGIAAEDILGQFRDLTETKFAVIADVYCSQQHAKSDVIIWHMSVRIECLSTYRGRMKIAEMIQEIGKAVTSTEQAFDANLAARGYRLIRLDVGDAAIGSSSHDGGITWQNGYLTVDYWLGQIEN